MAGSCHLEKYILYLHHRLTNFDEISHGDASQPLSNKIFKIVRF